MIREINSSVGADIIIKKDGNTIAKLHVDNMRGGIDTDKLGYMSTYLDEFQKPLIELEVK